MANNNSIGKIKKVPLDTIWRHEAKDFTTWMQEHIDNLDEIVDIGLQKPEIEQSTGNFRVDLVAEDREGNVVIIENQLKKSDHDHLGKIITYLSAVGASKAIWVVAEPRQEHVKAITWLNEATDVEFYLLKIEGIKIGDSLPAPLFTLIVGPSEEVREANNTKKEYAENDHLRKDFWTMLLEKSNKKTHLFSNISPSIGTWIGRGSGITGVTFTYIVAKNDSRIELYIDTDRETGAKNKKIFDELYKNKNEIEKKFGGQLDWDRLDNKRASRISKSFKLGGYNDKEKWEIVIEEMVNEMIKFETALSPYISKIRKS